MALARLGVITDWKTLEEQIIFYRSHLDIFIEDAFPPIKLSEEQHVIARAFGNCDDVSIVQSRGSGKTWLTAICAHSMAVLYPGTLVAICAPTAAQATLVLEKLKMMVDQNPNVANELTAGAAKNLVQLSKDKGKASYKNGSKIESFAMESMRGQRAKIVIIDETRDVDYETMEAVVSPVKNYRREISRNYNFKDYASKTIRISSACEKAKPFYKDFVRNVRDVALGRPESFACALDYNAAVASGINDISYYLGEKERQPESVFAMEYESRFLGTATNSAFPYDLVQTCRTLKTVELEQPKSSKSRYVISLDIATSDAKDADNSILSVLKFNERADGSFARKLVYMRSFHGESLDVLSEEIRKLYHRAFPNAEKIVYDARGLGDSLDRFFDKEWVDILQDKEYPPLVVDDAPMKSGVSRAVLHPFRAVQSLNQRIYTNLRVALEKRSIELPISSRMLQQNEAAEGEGGKRLSLEQKAIYAETDALQIEMGNIVAVLSKSGNVLYDTPHKGMHKDRYSSLAMANDYISELEKLSIKRHKHAAPVVGLATAF